MKHKENVEIPATTEIRTTYVTCDFCSKKIEYLAYKTDEVTIRHKEGDSYPEIGGGAARFVDMCGKCFNEKLVPWIQSQGVEVQKEDWEY